MDRKEGKIRLAIPTIDLLECRKFKGGYYEDSNNDTDNYCPEYEDYEIDGGKIDQSIIVEDSGNGYDREDGFERDDNWNDNQDDYDQYEDYRAENDDTDGILSGNDDTDKGKVVVDDSVPKEIQDQMDSLLNSLPSAISNQDVRIISNPELLDTLAAKWGVEAKGAFLREGYVLPDGTVLKENTVLLGNGADISTVQQELIHGWQRSECFKEGATTNNSLSAMEFQAAILSDILFEINEGVSVVGREDMGTEYTDFLCECFEDEEGILNFDIDSFNYDYFIENFREFYEHWLEYYSGKPYGSGNDEHYDWNWDELLNR